LSRCCSGSCCLPWRRDLSRLPLLGCFCDFDSFSCHNPRTRGRTFTVRPRRLFFAVDEVILISSSSCRPFCSMQSEPGFEHVMIVKRRSSPTCGRTGRRAADTGAYSKILFHSAAIRHAALLNRRIRSYETANEPAFHDFFLHLLFPNRIQHSVQRTKCSGMYTDDSVGIFQKSLPYCRWCGFATRPSELADCENEYRCSYAACNSFSHGNRRINSKSYNEGLMTIQNLQIS